MFRIYDLIRDEILKIFTIGFIFERNETNAPFTIIAYDYVYEIELKDGNISGVD